MRIAAFDLGSTMACARDELGETHQTFDGDRARRLSFTWAWLVRMVQGADLVVYERPFARGQAATRSLWGLAGAIEMAAYDAGIPCLDIDPSTIKKWATGSGKADKEAMLRAARGMGYKGTNEHEADAYCLLHFVHDTTKEIPNARTRD